MARVTLTGLGGRFAVVVPLVIAASPPWARPRRALDARRPPTSAAVATPASAPSSALEPRCRDRSSVLPVRRRRVARLEWSGSCCSVTQRGDRCQLELEHRSVCQTRESLRAPPSFAHGSVLEMVSCFATNASLRRPFVALDGGRR